MNPMQFKMRKIQETWLSAPPIRLLTAFLLISAIFLGFGRAFGETIAVSMVIGNQELIPKSLFGPGQTLASLIASNYTEVSSIPILASALIFVALILFVVVLIFNLLGYLVLRRAGKRWKY